MKKSLIIFLLILFSTLIVYAEDSTNSSLNDSTKIVNLPAFDPWKSETSISPTWEKIINNFFGIGEKSEGDKTSVKEAIVLFLLFFFVFIVLSDLFIFVPFFRGRLLGIISLRFLVSLIISLIVSFTGMLLDLKNLFLSFSAFIIDAIGWEFLKTNAGIGSFIFILLFIVVVIIHEVIDYWINPMFLRYSKISRAESKGVVVQEAVENSESKNSNVPAPTDLKDPSTGL